MYLEKESNREKESMEKKKYHFVPRTNLCIHNIKGVIYCVASKLLAYVYELYTVPNDEDKKEQIK